MTDEERARFDALFDEAVAQLPPELQEYLQEAPLVVDDRPSVEMLESIGLESGEDLCGLHSGIALTERSVEHSGSPTDVINLFREGIVNAAGGWSHVNADDLVFEQIVITILHEIGHHFALEEDDLEALGFG